MAGVVKVVRNGNFLAVVAEREWTAIEAMRRLATEATWRETAKLPDETRLAATLMALPSQDSVILDRGRGSEAGHEIEAIFTRPYLVPRLDRPILRHRGSEGRFDDGLDSHARAFSTAQGARGNAANAAGQGALHPCRRRWLLRP